MHASPRQSITAFPTIQWLQDRAADRLPVTHQSLTRLPSRPTLSSHMINAMRTMLDASVRIEQNHWVATPDGDLPVDIVLHKDGKRMAICCRPAWVNANSDQDALILVYGGFDVLYRCALEDSLESSVDAAYALMQANPAWFSSFGRLSLGRRASDGVIEASLRSVRKGWKIEGPHGTIEALRLHVATDWVQAFERALRGGTGLALTA